LTACFTNDIVCAIELSIIKKMAEAFNGRFENKFYSGTTELASTFKRLRMEERLSPEEYLAIYGDDISQKLLHFKKQNPVPVLICAWNEAERLPRLLRSLSLSTIPVSPIVVDNNSNDGTGDLASDLGADVVGEKQQGIIPALVTGFRYLETNNLHGGILLTDADTCPLPTWALEMSRIGSEINDTAGGVLYGQPIYYGRVARDLVRNVSEFTGTFIYLAAKKVTAFGPNGYIRLGSNGNIIRQLTEELNPHVAQRTDRYIRDNILLAGGEVKKTLSASAMVFTLGDRYPTLRSLCRAFPYGNRMHDSYKEWLSRPGAMYYRSDYDLWR
jgi:glycosyltransferase involved in cell wall biosynthesis